jgi:hypothetical protein
MKITKVFGGIVVLFVLVLVGAGLYVFSNLNHLIKVAVERVGPAVTGTAVSLNKVNVEVTKGRGELQSFTVANPQGFDSAHLLRWDKIVLQIDPASVRSEVIVIKDIVIEGVNIIAEQKGLNTNLQEMLKKFKGDSSESASKEEAGEEVRLMVEHIRFADNSISLVTEKLGNYDLKIPALKLNDLGDKATGLTPKELGKAILEPLIRQAKIAAETRIKWLAKEELAAKLKAKTDEFKTKAKDKEAELKSQAEEKETELRDSFDSKKDEFKNKFNKLLSK